jgi:hypothetical protein
MKILTISLLFLIGMQGYCQNYDQYGDIPYSNAIEEIQQYFGLQLSSIGGGIPCGTGIHKLALGFDVNRNLTVDEARRIVVACSEIFLRNINSSIKTRPTLIEYPFPITRIMLDVFINPSIESRNFCVASVGFGSFECVVFEGNPTKVRIIHEEPIETSLRILREEQELKTNLQQNTNHQANKENHDT